MTKPIILTPKYPEREGQCDCDCACSQDCACEQALPNPQSLWEKASRDFDDLAEEVRLSMGNMA